MTFVSILAKNPNGWLWALAYTHVIYFFFCENIELRTFLYIKIVCANNQQGNAVCIRLLACR